MHSLAIKEPVKTIFIVLILCHSIPLRKYMKQELIVPGLAKVVWHRGKAVVLYPTNAAAIFIAVLALRGKPATPAANVSLRARRQHVCHWANYAVSGATIAAAR